MFWQADATEVPFPRFVEGNPTYTGSCWGRGDLQLIYALNSRQMSMGLNGTELKRG